MFDPKTLKKNIISDLRVELAEEFDKNFQRKAFFTERWKKNRNPNARGSLLVVTGTLRRSIQASETPDGVRFTKSRASSIKTSFVVWFFSYLVIWLVVLLLVF